MNGPLDEIWIHWLKAGWENQSFLKISSLNKQLLETHTFYKSNLIKEMVSEKTKVFSGSDFSPIDNCISISLDQ